jgi:hypothetical protein
MKVIAVGMFTNMNSMRPPARSVSAMGLELYGTCTPSKPPCRRKSSVARNGELPAPTVAQVGPPGLLLA